MANRNTEAARAIRRELLVKLGAFCVLCGEEDDGLLEFDHIEGRAYLPHKKSYRHRMTIYRREAERGLLRVLCKACNLKVRRRNDNGVCVPTSFEVPLTADLPF